MIGRRASLLFALILAGTGCGGVRAPVFEPAGGGAPVWPPPPATARVAWSGQYAARDAGFVRPHGVGAGAGGTLCVADPGARLVWLQRPDERGLPLGRGELASPVDCVPDGEGVLVADSAAGRVIALDRRGKVRWRSADGALARPTGMAVDRERERIWVADATRHRLVALDRQGRAVEALGGRGAEPGRFNFPVDVALGPEGALYVLDSMNFRVQVLDRSGRPIRAFGFAGDGPGTFSRPRGLGVDAAGRVYVADALFDNVQIFDASGRLLLAVGRRGRGPGQFWMPAGVAVAPDGRFFVADAYNHRVQVFRLVGEEAGT